MRAQSVADMTVTSCVQGLTMRSMHQRLIVALTLLLACALSVTATRSAHAANAPAPKQRTFATAQAAMEGFAAAIANGDVAGLWAILGPEGEAILKSGDPVEDRESLSRFDRAYKESHKLEERSPTEAWISVGKDDWPLPIPIVKKGETWVMR